MHYTRKAPKRAYYLSLEWLMGRTLDNAMLNLGLKDKYREGTSKLGFVRIFSYRARDRI
jgi:starch phosphorylase